ncbi:hypothetical protein [Gulosibacter sediminis]|uniref:hypothetical protein n=1 Tax=Gulosibacter sediminis TaxID=1729695 RepID=UPI0024A94FAD|nr:hypothetical protein [Gulosibacter sediminis]
MVANAWLNDTRVSERALLVYLWIRQHAPGFAVSRSAIMNGRNMRKDALTSAINELIEHGYLRKIEGRWPAGTVTKTGRKIGGAKRIQYEVLEPTLAETTAAPADDPILPAGAPDSIAGVDGPRDPHQDAGDVNHGGKSALVYPQAEEQKNQGGKSALVYPQASQDQGGKSALVAPAGENQGGKPSVGFPPLNKTNKTKQSSSSVGDQQTARAVIATQPDDDEISSSGDVVVPGRRVFGVDVDELQRRLGPLAKDVDLELAIVTVLGRASTPPVHPVAFVARAVTANPGEFPAGPTRHLAPVGLGSGEAGSAPGSSVAVLRDAVTRQCQRIGHQWRATAEGGMACVRCGVGAEEHAAEHAASCRAAADGHDTTGSDRCRWCGFDSAADTAARVVAARAHCASDGHAWNPPMTGLPPAGVAGFRNGDRTCGSGCGAVERDGVPGHMVGAGVRRGWQASGEPSASQDRTGAVG